MKLLQCLIESLGKSYKGNCVNSFDEDGYCTSELPYNDTTDFAQGEDSSSHISKEDFLKHIPENNIPDTVKKLLSKKDTSYLHDTDNDVHMIYDPKKDIHHFFN